MLSFFNTNFKTNDLVILHVNVRSLNKNLGNLEELICFMHAQPDLIAITETKLNFNSSLDLVKIAGYKFYNRNSLSMSGGVGLYVKDGLDIIPRNDIELFSSDFESLWFETRYSAGGKAIVIGVVYRHPRHDISTFTNELNLILEKLTLENKTVLITGDFNVDLFRVNNNRYISDYNDMMLSYHMNNEIKSATRITDSSSTLIDHFYNNNPSLTINTTLVLDDLSDHFPIIAIVKQSKVQTKKKHYYTRNYSLLDPTQLTNDATVTINNLTQTFSSLDLDINNKFKLLGDGLLTILDSNIPVQKLSRKKSRLKLRPWISAGILKSIKRRNKMYKVLCTTKFQDENFHKEYKLYRNALTRIKETAKRNYFHKKLQSSNGDVKQTWRVINDVIGKSSKPSSIPTEMSFEGSKVVNPREIVDKLNIHFTEIGKHSTNHVDFDKVANTVRWNTNSIFFSKTTPAEIENIIDHLNIRKASGADDISVSLLKQLKGLLSPLLSDLINEAFESGLYPDILKLAKVIPLHKGGVDSDPGNYRPISILSNLNKILEKVIYPRLYNFFEKFNILSDKQFGFRKGLSTTMATAEFLENVLHSIDEQKATCAMFVDLSKAFDCVNWDILLFKLYRYGIRGEVWNLIKSYLTNRKQYVDCDGVKSAEEELTIGVPQGSVLGPLLFLVHISDLRYATTLENLNFADDTMLYKTFEKSDEIQKIMNEEMMKVNNWLDTNHLRLNTSKTKYMIFCKDLKKFKSLDKIKLKIGAKEVEQVEEIRYLGLTIDKHLNWKQHLRSLSTKLSKSLGILFKIRHYLDKKSLLLILHSLFLSHIKYGILCWGRTKSSILKPISILLNRALRCINYADNRATINPFYIKENILKVEDIFKLEVCKFIYKWKNGILPSNLNLHFNNTNITHNYNTRHTKHNMYLNRKHTKKGMETLNFLGVRLWCGIPDSIKVNTSVYSFTKKCKEYLLNNYRED